MNDKEKIKESLDHIDHLKMATEVAVLNEQIFGVLKKKIPSDYLAGAIIQLKIWCLGIRMD